MSKLRVALSRFYDLPFVAGLGLKGSTWQAKAVSEKFYLKTLPKFVTIPKHSNAIPSVNVWLWLIGYLKLQWPGAEKNLEKTKFIRQVDWKKYLEKMKNIRQKVQQQN